MCLYLPDFCQFSFSFSFNPSQSPEMGPGKINETTNQLNLALLQIKLHMYENILRILSAKFRNCP